MKTRKLTFAALLVSIGVILGNLVYIPIGMSKCFPIQHAINLISAVSLGPVFSVSIAFVISLIRNILGPGSLLAFPGSMIGALLAALIYKYSSNKILAGVGELIGTGLLGGLLAYPLASYFMAKELALLFYVYPFFISSLGGVILGLILLKLIDFEKLVNKDRRYS